MLFVEEISGTYGCEASVGERVLWRSPDGGATWVADGTERDLTMGRVAKRSRLGRRVPIPGGFIAAMRGAPARVTIQEPRSLVRVTLPRAGRCSLEATTPVVDWPAVYVAGRTRDGSAPVRWWSADGGARWAVFGSC